WCVLQISEFKIWISVRNLLSVSCCLILSCIISDLLAKDGHFVWKGNCTRTGRVCSICPARNLYRKFEYGEAEHDKKCHRNYGLVVSSRAGSIDRAAVEPGGGQRADSRPHHGPKRSGSPERQGDGQANQHRFRTNNGDRRERDLRTPESSSGTLQPRGTGRRFPSLRADGHRPRSQQ